MLNPRNRYDFHDATKPKFVLSSCLFSFCHPPQTTYKNNFQIAQGQRVAKLDEKQTADMIKITCQRPDVRQGAIHQQFNNINSKSTPNYPPLFCRFICAKALKQVARLWS